MPNIRIGGQPGNSGQIGKISIKTSSDDTSSNVVSNDEPDTTEDTDTMPDISDMGMPDVGAAIPPKQVIPAEHDNKDDDSVDKSDMSPSELKRYNKQKSKGKNKKRKNTSGPNEPLDMNKAYAEYRKRKIIVFAMMILFVVVIIGLGIFNVFFKHQLTQDEAATYTNSVNNQSLAQGWDSGIQSFLQKNLPTLMKKSFQSTATNKDFSVDNISVEKNQPFGDTTFLTFFSCDVTSNGTTERVFCNIFIDTSGGKYKATSNVNISTRESYSSDAEISDKNEYLDFTGIDVDTEATKEFTQTLENFLTLGYNTKQDVSDIYKGSAALSFSGTFKSLDKVSVYESADEMGFNAVALYTIELKSGLTYQDKMYMKIEKNSSGSYVIDMIL